MRCAKLPEPLRPPARALCAIAALLLAFVAAPPASAEERWLLQGLFDGELWNTDAGSALLARNEGETASAGRLRLWMATDFHPRVQLVGVGAFESGNAEDEDGIEHELEQAFVRWSLTRQRSLTLDVGRLPAPLGNFSRRYFSNVNPLIGAPDGYDVSYPNGAQLTGKISRWDFRVAVVDQPVTNESYLPEASSAARPALATGFTPMTGLRIGSYWTGGPYLGRDIEPLLPAGGSWRDYDQGITGADFQFSRGYFELHGDYALSTYEVPGLDRELDGRAWFVEPKYTWSPRWFTALRVEGNRYAYVAPQPGEWTASVVTFHDLEVGVGYRLGSETLLKASYREDRWRVEDYLATILPDGHSVAVQLSHRFDVRRWFEPLH